MANFVKIYMEIFTIRNMEAFAFYQDIGDHTNFGAEHEHHLR